MSDTAIATIEPGIVQVIRKYKPDFKQLLPAGMINKFMAVSASMFRINPALLDCSADSIMDALMKSAQLGVLPDGIRGYLIPYKTTATFQIGYKGLMELALRSGKVSKIFSQTVHENDYFEYALGLADKLEHRPAIGDRGKMIGAYAYAALTDGGTVQDYMSIAELERIRDRSPAGEDGPWVTDTSEMYRKTVTKRLCKYLPMAENLMTAAAMDDIAEADSDGVVIAPTVAITRKSGMKKLKSAVVAQGKPAEREPGDDDVPLPEPEPTPVELDKHARFIGIKQAITHGTELERESAWGVFCQVQKDYTKDEIKDMGKLYTSMKGK
jgi:recombination protein RecT